MDKKQSWVLGYFHLRDEVKRCSGKACGLRAIMEGVKCLIQIQRQCFLLSMALKHRRWKEGL